MSEHDEDLAKRQEEQERLEKVDHTGGDLGRAEAQELSDVATEQGFIGVKVDPTPNENYSLQTGPEAPTPETDVDAAIEADKAVFGNRIRNVEQDSAQTAEHNA